MTIDVEYLDQYYQSVQLVGERRRAGEPIGYPPNNFVRNGLEKQYISIVGAIDLGDFETFLRESADLTYEEAKEKMISLYGTPKELSQAAARAKSRQAKELIQAYEQQAESEQRSLEDELADVEEIARNRLEENMELTRRVQELEAEIEGLRVVPVKKEVLPPAPAIVPTPAPIVAQRPTLPPTTVLPYKPLGYPPDPNSRKILANIYTTVFGEMNEQDFDDFLRASANLTLAAAKDKLAAIFWEVLSASEAPESPQIPEVPAAQAAPAIPCPTPPPPPPVTEKPGGLRPEEYVFIPPVPHGTMYHAIKDMISPAMSRSEINELADEIYDILEHEEYDKLSREEANSIIKQLSSLDAQKYVEEQEREAAAPPIPRVPEMREVIYRYHNPRTEVEISPTGEKFERDLELEDVLKSNHILNFPDIWYRRSPTDKMRLHGYNMGTAIIEQVEYRHRFTWDELHRDYGIPQDYIGKWIKYGKSIGLIQ